MKIEITERAEVKYTDDRGIVHDCVIPKGSRVDVPRTIPQSVADDLIFKKKAIAIIPAAFKEKPILAPKKKRKKKAKED